MTVSWCSTSGWSCWRLPRTPLRGSGRTLRRREKPANPSWWEWRHRKAAKERRRPPFAPTTYRLTALDGAPIIARKARVRMARKTYILGSRVVLGLRHHCAGRCFLTYSFPPPRHLRAGLQSDYFPGPRIPLRRTRGCLLPPELSAPVLMVGCAIRGRASAPPAIALVTKSPGSLRASLPAVNF